MKNEDDLKKMKKMKTTLKKKLKKKLIGCDIIVNWPSILQFWSFLAAKQALYSGISLRDSPLALIWTFSFQWNKGYYRISKNQAGPLGII